MRLITVKLPEPYIEAMDELVRRGRYSSPSEIIRDVVKRLLMEKRMLMKLGLGVSMRENL